jgi:ABC-type nitrate/sulfonate/bicarbonate transport system substrate-binding protein
MLVPKKLWRWIIIAASIANGLLPVSGRADEKLLVAYGGHNENVAPMWVGIEKGTFKKYGLDVSMLQVRSGPMIMATLASGSVQVTWPASSSVLSAASGGVKVVCVASPNNKIPRELVVRKEIKSFEELRGRVIGVQSIGGGFWLQTMIVLDNIGLDPEKYQLKMRVIGDTATITQALISGNIDAAVLPYSFSSMVKRAGYRSLVDSGELKAPYQGSGLCAQREAIVHSPDLIMGLVKGLIEAVLIIHDPSHKQDVMKILKKNLRLAKAEDVESSYKVLRVQTTLDVAPNLPSWRATQRIVARVNPRVGQVDIEQLLEGSFVRSLEESGFLPEMRRRLKD